MSEIHITSSGYVFLIMYTYIICNVTCGGKSVKNNVLRSVSRDEIGNGMAGGRYLIPIHLSIH